MSGRPFNGASQVEDHSNFLLMSFSRLTVILFYSQPQYILRVKSPESLCLGLLYLHFTFSRKISPYYY